MEERIEGEPTPVHTKDDDLESFWHVLFWIALRRCEHGKDIEHIQYVMSDIYDRRRHAENGGPRAAGAKRDMLTSERTVEDQLFASPALRDFLEEYQKVINKRYVLNAENWSLLNSCYRDFIAIHPDATNTEIVDKLSEFTKRNKKFPAIRPEYFVQSVQPGWVPAYCAEFFATTKAEDWLIGYGNIPRPELLTSRQSSFNKRKSDSQYSFRSSGNDVNDDGKPRNKRPRKEPALPSVHEEGE